jgi:hypothetical protein
MGVANTLSYHNMTTIIAVIRFIVQAPFVFELKLELRLFLLIGIDIFEENKKYLNASTLFLILMSLV